MIVVSLLGSRARANLFRACCVKTAFSDRCLHSVFDRGTLAFVRGAGTLELGPKSKFWQGTAKLLFCRVSKQLKPVHEILRKRWVGLKKQQYPQVYADLKVAHLRVRDIAVAR